MNKLLVAILFQLSSALAIIPEKSTRDTYISAYMDSQTASELPAGVVYPEPSRTYGLPQHKPPSPVYYGPPVGHPVGPPIEYGSPFPSVFEILSHLPEKLEFVPKVASVMLTLTKIMLKVVLLKVILKFIFMFCLFFFLPKLDMLDMVTSLESGATTMKPSSHNSTHSAESADADDQEEMRLNKMSNFVWDSIETQSFLRKYCDENERSQKCKFMRTLSKLEKVVSLPRLFNAMWVSTVNKLSGKSRKLKKV